MCGIAGCIGVKDVQTENRKEKISKLKDVNLRVDL
jgi:hypothetical protein